ncbi:MAG: hypothetical protein KBC74_01825 [Candidatus Pacebacteria bacterium]|nr:hypothetical protein [Candidatus Paceibacterota bacterium]MBP9832243.1 hypothetical protein [Candidatus Paceibacterota bacterium]
MAEGLHPRSEPVAGLIRKIRMAGSGDLKTAPLVERVMEIFSPLTPDEKRRVEAEAGALLSISQSPQP